MGFHLFVLAKSRYCEVRTLKELLFIFYQLESITMAEAVAFGALLQHIGVDHADARAFVAAQGYPTIAEFASVPYDGVESFVRYLNKAATTHDEEIKHGSIGKLLGRDVNRSAALFFYLF